MPRPSLDEIFATSAPAQSAAGSSGRQSLDDIFGNSSGAPAPAATTAPVAPAAVHQPADAGGLEVRDRPLDQKASLDEIFNSPGPGGSVTHAQPSAPQQPTGFLDRAAGAVDKAYNVFSNLPVIKQASQVAGAAVGAAGALEGGIVGGAGQIVQNIRKGQPITQNVVRSAIDTGKETAGFGYDVGKNGVPAFLAGEVGGVIPNAIMAGSQIYQGAKTLKNAQTAEDYVQGGLQLGTGAFGAFGSAKGARNVAADIKAGDYAGAAKKTAFNPEGAARVKETAQIAASKVKPAIAAVGDKAGNVVRYGVAQATGLNPETVSEVIKRPEAFTKKAQSEVDRGSLGQQTQSAIEKRSRDLSDTGKVYDVVRKIADPVRVEPTSLESFIKEDTGVNVKNGRITATGASKIRDAGDVRALQHLYDLWQPVFKNGKLTINEFLNFRDDLAKLSRFERQTGKSKPIENVTSIIRGKFNEKYRGQVQGLAELDSTFSAENADLVRLKRNLVDRNGNLTDAAINRVANATGKGKDVLLGRLEELVPGISEKIKVLKAVEDIQHASGAKVGTYVRGGIAATGAATGNIPLIVTTILSQPELAVPIMRRYGMSRNLVTEVIKGLRDRVSGKKPGAGPAAPGPEPVGPQPQPRKKGFGPRQQPENDVDKEAQRMRDLNELPF